MALSIDSFMERNNKERVDFFIIAIGIIIVAFCIMVYKLITKDINDPGQWEDVSNYYHQFLELAEGKIPYKDFTFEYPPLMLIFISIGGLLSHDFAVYVVVYMIMVILFYVLTAYYLNRITEKLNVSNKLLFLILVTTLLFLYTRVLLRNDIFAMFFIVIALYYYLDKKYPISFVLIALGVMTKIFPIVIAFAMIIPFIYRRQYVDFVKYVGISVGICLIISIPFLIMDPGSAFNYLTYHSDRGLQVESIAASFIDTINLFVNIATPTWGHGSFNIAGTIPDAVAKILTPIMIIAFLAMFVWCIREKRKSNRFEDEKLVVFLCSVFIMTFVIFNKVFSTQYMLWIMLLFALVLCLEKDKKMRIELASLSVIILIFSYLQSYTVSTSMTNLEALGTIVLLIRNILVIALFVITIRILYANFKNNECHE